MSTIEAEAAALREIAESSNAWPFEEARKIVARLKKHPKDVVTFETGYGPSACRISGLSARSRAPRWCAMPSAS
jgi:hypothetical protein